MAYSMNKQREGHMNEEPPAPHGKPTEGHGPSTHPHIHVHSHAKGHTVHVMHADGGHDQHEHAPGDAEGIAQHIRTHIGAAGGQPVTGDDENLDAI